MPTFLEPGRTQHHPVLGGPWERSSFNPVRRIKEHLLNTSSSTRHRLTAGHTEPTHKSRTPMIPSYWLNDPTNASSANEVLRKKTLLESCFMLGERTVAYKQPMPFHKTAKMSASGIEES